MLDRRLCIQVVAALCVVGYVSGQSNEGSASAWYGESTHSGTKEGSEWGEESPTTGSGWTEDWSSGPSSTSPQSPWSPWFDKNGFTLWDPIPNLWNGVGDFGGAWNWDSPHPPAGLTYTPDLLGEVALRPRIKYYLRTNESLNIPYYEDHSSSELPPCWSRFCVHLTFYSDYGAMSDFDAFVLDRYESKFPLETWDLYPGNSAPLVLGQLSEDELSRISQGDINFTERFNETRATRLTLNYPADEDATEIDLVLSFKQLYTLLPNFNGTDPASNGPFYSDDLNDQVIIRLLAQLASPYASTVAILPTILNTTGSKLFDVDYVSSILYDDTNMQGGNRIAIDIFFHRKRYGGMLPWMPAEESRECKACAALLFADNSSVANCIRDSIPEDVFQELFTVSIEKYSLDDIAQNCFERIRSPDFQNDLFSMGSFGNEPSKYLDEVQQVEAGIQCYVQSQCPIGDRNRVQAAGRMIVMSYKEAFTLIRFNESQYEFSLSVELAGTTFTTPVMTNTHSEDEIIERFISADSRLSQYRMNIQVRMYNNSQEIQDIQDYNDRVMAEYNNLHRSSSDSNDGSVGDWVGYSGDYGSSQENLTHEQWPPKLYEVPEPAFVVEFVFANVSITPTVNEIYSSQLFQWTFERSRFRIELRDLVLSKFSYVPPPKGIDLDWYESTDDDFSSLPSDLSCFECLQKLYDCFYDEDCLFGTRAYLFETLQRDDFGRNYSTYWQNDTLFIQVDISRAFREASVFFPPHGYEKMTEFISCLASRTPVCNVDFPRMETDTGSGLFERGPPTYLVLEPVTIDLIVNTNRSFYIRNGTHEFKYMERGDSEDLRRFLQNVVMDQDSSVLIRVDLNEDGDRNKYRITLDRYLKDPISFAQADTSSDMYVFSRSWRLLVETRRQPNRILEDPASVIQWPRLLDWLHILIFDKGNTTSGNSSVPSYPGNPPTTTVIHKSSDAICPECMDKLSACLRDSDCANDTRKYLLTSLDPAQFGQSWDFSDPYYIQDFSSIFLDYATQFTERGYEKFIDVLQCVTMRNCAIGYSPYSGSSPQMPTRMLFQNQMTLRIQPNSTINLTYNGETFIFQENGSTNDFLGFVFAAIQERVGMSTYYTQAADDNHREYILTYFGPLSKYPEFSCDPPAEVGNITTKVMFGSQGIPLNWENLLGWFGRSETSTSLDVCMQCLPVLENCFYDSLCAKGTQQTVAPYLKNTLPQSFVSLENFRNGSTRYSMDLSESLQTYLTELWSNNTEREKFTSIIECLSERPCDLEYMTPAMDVPATAHIPTYLKLKDATAEFILFPETTVYFYFNEEQFTFSLGPTNAVSDFVNFYTKMVAGANIPVNFTLAEYYGTDNSFRYNITLPRYIGTIPYVQNVVGPQNMDGQQPRAQVTMWQVTVESINQRPEWPKLVDFLSLSPSTWLQGTETTTDPSSLSRCPECTKVLSICYQDYECQSILVNKAIPYLSTMTPSSNANGSYAWNFTDTLKFQVFPFTSVYSQQLLMSVFRCSSSSSCIKASCDQGTPGSSAFIDFKKTTVEFNLPIGVDMRIWFEGVGYVYRENGDTEALKTFLEETVMQYYDTVVDVSMQSSSSSGHRIYLFVYEFIGGPVPRFSFDTDTEYGESVVRSDWSLVFTSTAENIHDSYAAWIKWVSTNPNTS